MSGNHSSDQSDFSFRIGQEVTYIETGAIQARLQVVSVGFIFDIHGDRKEIYLVEMLGLPPDMHMEKFLYATDLKPF